MGNITGTSISGHRTMLAAIPVVINWKQFHFQSSDAGVCSLQSADAVRKDATLSSTQQSFILNLASCLVSLSSSRVIVSVLVTMTIARNTVCMFCILPQRADV